MSIHSAGLVSLAGSNTFRLAGTDSHSRYRRSGDSARTDSTGTATFRSALIDVVDLGTRGDEIYQEDSDPISVDSEDEPEPRDVTAPDTHDARVILARSVIRGMQEGLVYELETKDYASKPGYIASFLLLARFELESTGLTETQLVHILNAIYLEFQCWSPALRRNFCEHLYNYRSRNRLPSIWRAHGALGLILTELNGLLPSR